MYKTIIVPLDGSPFAERALPTAVAIAKCSSAQLVLLRVHESYAYESTDYGLLGETSRRDQEEYLTLIARRMEDSHGLTPQRAALDGAIAPAIGDYALGMESPLIVLSTHGRTGFSRLWLGSVADAMMRHAPVPLLMLRHRKPADPLGELAPHPFANILVPLDGSAFAEVALPHAESLAVTFGARLTLVRVVAPAAAPAPFATAPSVALPADQERFNIRLEDAEEYVGAVRRRVLVEEPAIIADADVCVSEKPATAILDAVRRHGADTVVLATHGRGLSRMVIASVADKVLRGGPDAVLVLRAEDTTD